MIRIRTIFLLVLLFAIVLSACAPGAQYTLPPGLTLIPGTDIQQQAATYVSNAFTQTAAAGIPATATPVYESTLSIVADTLTPTPGGIILPTPMQIPYRTLYQSPSLGVQFSYPSAWYRRETNGGITLTSFDPTNPPHKLEWSDQTTSMQFTCKLLFAPPASFDAWVEDAKQTALANGLTVYAEERVQLWLSNQPAAHLTLVSGSGGIIHQVLTTPNGCYFEIFIEGNFDLARAVMDSMQASTEGVIAPPDGNTPTAGICADAQSDPVNIILGTDASGMPLAGRCIAVNPALRIKLINQSVNPIKLRLMEYPITLPVGGEILLDKPIGQYLALGVHFLPIAPELWVKESITATAPPPIVEYVNSAVGYRLNLPGDWNINETDNVNKEALFSPPYAEPFIAYLSVSLESRTLDQVIDFYTQNTNTLNVVREDTMFYGHPAVKYIFANGRNEYFIPYGTQLFLIATDRPNDSLVQSILMTFRFMTPPQPITHDATMADNGKTFVMNIGDKIRINLDYGYGWSTISDFNPAILMGAGDGYFAIANGTSTLTLTGVPVCYSSTPPCLAPSIQYTITVIVR